MDKIIDEYERAPYYIIYIEMASQENKEFRIQS